MKTIRITAEYRASITREVEIDDNVDVSLLLQRDFEELYRAKYGTFNPANDEEVNTLLKNIGEVDVWLVNDENGNDIWYN